jgi:hypothetical protein
MDREAAFGYITDCWAQVTKAQDLPLLSKERRAAVKAANERLAGVNWIVRELAPTSRRSAPADWVTMSLPGPRSAARSA